MLRQASAVAFRAMADQKQHDRMGKRPAGVDIAGRGGHSVSGLHPRHIMKNILSLCVALTVLALSARGADTPKDKGADELWQTIQLMQRASPPQDRSEYPGRLRQWQSVLLEFEHRFPTDPRRWDCKLGRLQVEAALARIENHPTDDAALLAMAKEILAAPDASAETKADADYLVAMERLGALGAAESVTNGPARAAADAAIQELRQKYPDDQRTVQIQFGMAQLLKLRDPAATESILRELATSKNPQAAAMASQPLRGQS